jgi:hypothetical protein
LFRNTAPYLGLKNDLLLIIINGNTIVTLNGAFTGGHFGAVWVSDITFYGLAGAAYFFFVCSKQVSNFFDAIIKLFFLL